MSSAGRALGATSCGTGSHPCFFVLGIISISIEDRSITDGWCTCTFTYCRSADGMPTMRSAGVAVRGSEAIMAPDSSERETNGSLPPPITAMAWHVLLSTPYVSSQPDKTGRSIRVVIVIGFTIHQIKIRIQSISPKATSIIYSSKDRHDDPVLTTYTDTRYTQQ